MDVQGDANLRPKGGCAPLGNEKALCLYARRMGQIRVCVDFQDLNVACP
nr:hypothetical protein Iba_chr11aCG13770 [Ipomoea batatas]